jgi:hypothetical protein
MRAIFKRFSRMQKLERTTSRAAFMGCGLGMPLRGAGQSGQAL